MHQSSYCRMASLLEKYCSEEHQSVCDIGSRGEFTYRPICDNLGLNYTGIDIIKGSNVDVVVSPSGGWDSHIQKFDIAISGQCLEHVGRPWEWIFHIKSITRLGGLIIIIAPWNWAIHNHPIDCWRILPDGMKALMEYASLRVLEVGMGGKDCFGVGKVFT